MFHFVFTILFFHEHHSIILVSRDYGIEERNFFGRNSSRVAIFDDKFSRDMKCKMERTHSQKLLAKLNFIYKRLENKQVL